MNEALVEKLRAHARNPRADVAMLRKSLLDAAAALEQASEGPISAAQAWHLKSAIATRAAEIRREALQEGQLSDPRWILVAGLFEAVSIVERAAGGAK